MDAVCEHQVREGMLTMTLTQARSLARRGPSLNLSHPETDTVSLFDTALLSGVAGLAL